MVLNILFLHGLSSESQFGLEIHFFLAWSMPLFKKKMAYINILCLLGSRLHRGQTSVHISSTLPWASWGLGKGPGTNSCCFGLGLFRIRGWHRLPTFLLILDLGIFRVKAWPRPTSILVLGQDSSGKGIGPGPHHFLLLAQDSSRVRYRPRPLQGSGLGLCPYCFLHLTWATSRVRDRPTPIPLLVFSQGLFKDQG